MFCEITQKKDLCTDFYTYGYNEFVQSVQDIVLNKSVSNRTETLTRLRIILDEVKDILHTDKKRSLGNLLCCNHVMYVNEEIAHRFAEKIRKEVRKRKIYMSPEKYFFNPFEEWLKNPRPNLHIAGLLLR